MILLIDNFDSFTYNLVDYFYRAGAACEVVRNDIATSKVDLSKYTGIVLSPGPQTPTKAGYLMDHLSASHSTLPMLGICLGHQAIGQFFGAKLIKGIKPVHGKVHKIHLKQDRIFTGIDPITEVVRYNSLVVTAIPNCLNIIAQTEEGEVMAIKHKDLPLWGLQFHPEAALTRDGLLMIKNWVSCNNIV